MPKSNEAAKDLWSQIFASRAKADHATLLDPETDRAALREASEMRGGLIATFNKLSSDRNLLRAPLPQPAQA